MKIRTGFVSNSSSSSFLIFVGKKELQWKLQLGSTGHELSISDLESLIERSDRLCYEAEFRWISADDAREYIDERWLDEAEKKELLFKIDQLTTDIDERDNYHFAKVEYSHHDSVSAAVFEAMVEEGIIDKIYEMEN